MQIISHRGCWQSDSEKNTRKAFQRSFENGFGLETDLRDFQRNIIISHDMPIGNEMGFNDLLDLANEKEYTLALNIKSDGMASTLNRMLEKNEIKYFVFDMSIPDMKQYIDLAMPVYTRISEIESVPCFYKESVGIWLDAFFSDWYLPSHIEKWINDGKKVCIVSPELHKRDYLPSWEMLKQNNFSNSQNLILCTDFPIKAKSFFEIV